MHRDSDRNLDWGRELKRLGDNLLFMHRYREKCSFVAGRESLFQLLRFHLEQGQGPVLIAVSVDHNGVIWGQEWRPGQEEFRLKGVVSQS